MNLLWPVGIDTLILERKAAGTAREVRLSSCSYPNSLWALLKVRCIECKNQSHETSLKHAVLMHQGELSSVLALFAELTAGRDEAEKGPQLRP
eukprot:1490382-Amphidinium_carterae.1